jgi:hypothetical protein
MKVKGRFDKFPMDFTRKENNHAARTSQTG